jgi:hypothetical protein
VAGRIGEIENHPSRRLADGRIEMGQTLLHVPENKYLFNNGFKECCALLFCKGALLIDAHGILAAKKA